MRTLGLIVVSAISLSTAACVTDGVAGPPPLVSRPPGPPTCAPPACLADRPDPPTEIVRLGELAGPSDGDAGSGTPFGTRDGRDRPGALPETVDGVGDVCACRTEACVDSWVNAELGCDVCVTFLCDGRVVDDCVLCPPPPTGSCAAEASPRGARAEGCDLRG